MTEICRTLDAIQLQNKKYNSKTKNEENAIVVQLTDKMHRLKFRLLDLQNQNQALRKELLLANKVLDTEVPNGPKGDLRKHLTPGDFTGYQDDEISLRHKILQLQNRIRRLESGEGSSSCDDLKMRKGASSDGKRMKKDPDTPSEKSCKQDGVIAGCVVVKGKIDYFKNRNKDLKQETDLLRLELDRLAEKNGGNQEIQKTYMVVERELRDRQNERLDIRTKLSAAKTRNQQLEEEVSALGEDLHKMASKASDDIMLLEALRSQQDNFQDLMERQKMLCESDNRRFREDLRQVQTKHTTNVNLLYQLQEFSNESDSLLQQLQHPTPLAIYVSEEEVLDSATASTTTLSTVTTQQTTLPDTNKTDTSEDGSVTTEQKPPEPPNEEVEKLKKEKESAKQIFESAQDEVEHLAEIAISNNNKLNEWRGQLLHSRALYYQKCAEVHELETRRVQDNAGKKDKSARENYKNLIDELFTKKELEEEAHRFLVDLWHVIAAGTVIVFQIYTTSVDRTKKLYLEGLKPWKKELAEASAESVAAQPPNGVEQPTS